MIVTTSITITELLKKHKEIIKMLENVEGSIPVISNSKVAFYISKNPVTESAKLAKPPLKRHVFSVGIDKHISSKDMYD